MYSNNSTHRGRLLVDFSTLTHSENFVYILKIANFEAQNRANFEIFIIFIDVIVGKLYRICYQLFIYI